MPKTIGVKVTNSVGSRCGGECVIGTGRTSHCSVCHQTFSTVSNFDGHRRDGWCLEPGSTSLEASPRGVWHLPADPDRPFPGHGYAAEGPTGAFGTSGMGGAL